VHLHALVPSPAEWDVTPAALPRRGQHQEEHPVKRVMTVWLFVHGVYVFVQPRCECVEHREERALHRGERAVNREERALHRKERATYRNERVVGFARRLCWEAETAGSEPKWRAVTFPDRALVWPIRQTRPPRGASRAPEARVVLVVTMTRPCVRQRQTSAAQRAHAY
jgi:hypothetical protein